MATIKVYSIGYSGRTIQGYISVLKSAGVTTIVDVRDQPTSRFKPDFNKNALGASLKKAGLSYIHLKSCGNPKEIRDSADSWDGFKAHLKKNKAGIEDLIAIIQRNSAVALTCTCKAFGEAGSEYDPKRKEEFCHRFVLFEALVKKIPIKVVHL